MYKLRALQTQSAGAGEVEFTSSQPAVVYPLPLGSVAVCSRALRLCAGRIRRGNSRSKRRPEPRYKADWYAR